MKLGAVADEIAAAVSIASRHRLGAIIIVDPAGTVEGGVVLDARLTRELLVAVFTPEYLNRLYRGAVVIRGDRVERAGVPIAWAEVVARAAELAAGIAIAVDEDSGEIRIVDREGCVEAAAMEGFIGIRLGRVLGPGR